MTADWEEKLRLRCTPSISRSADPPIFYSVPDDLNIAAGDGHLNHAVLIVDPEDPLGGVGVAALIVEPGKRLRAAHVQLDLVEFALHAFHHDFFLADEFKGGVAGGVLAGDQDHEFADGAEQAIILAAAAIGQI